MTWAFDKFDKKFDRTKFNCGELALNDYLRKQMSQDVDRRANVPTLAVNTQDEVIGYYTLSNGAVEFANFPQNLKKEIAPSPVPIARIGRLAVDNSTKGQGLGRELLFHAIDKVEQLSIEIGIRSIVVDAKNPNAEAFYLKYGFQYLHTSGAKKSLFLMI